MKDNVVYNYVVLIVSVAAGLILLKFGASYLPDSGVFGALKRVVGSL